MLSSRKVFLTLFLITLVIVPVVKAETTRTGEQSCPEIVTRALETTNEVCEATSRNEACYGHIQLSASSQPNVDSFTFEQIGDLENVAAIQSLRLSGMEEEAGVWGVALMRLRASLPENARASNVTLLLFGQVEIENAVAAPTLSEITAPTNLNVRSLPALDAPVIANLGAGTIAKIDGRSTDNEWLHVLLEDGDQSGWVYTSVVMNPDKALALDVVDDATRRFQPMQAFYFQSGVNDAVCPEAPNSGLLIQTPEGVATVTFLINEVDIQLGSTVYFQADPGNEMTVTVVEGSATVRSQGVVSKATAGSQLTIPINDAMQADGPPGLPRAYEMASVNALPIQNLERAIEIHAPLTEEELTVLEAEIMTVNETAAESASESEAQGLGVVSGGEGREPEKGGGTANNPIFGENTPPQGGTSPGQEKKQ